MSDEQALLAAIRNNPDEDTPRLVYADWLDEQGGAVNQDRAEYIRLSISAARARRDVIPERTSGAEYLRLSAARTGTDLRRLKDGETQKRADALFAKYRGTWFPELFGRKNILRGVRGAPRMGRGFPDKLQGNGAKIISLGARLIELAPFTEFQLLDLTSRDLNSLASVGWARGLRTLGASGGYGAGEPDYAGLANGTHFGELRDLAITFGVLSRDGAERIASANPFPKLERFYFGSYTPDDTLPALFGGAAFTGLRFLTLSGGGSLRTPLPGFKAVCESKALAGLKGFDLVWRPTPGLVEMLTSAIFWPGLEELELLRNDLDDNDLAKLLNTPSQLKRLELDDNLITANGVRLLAEHPALANITKLDLGRNKIGDLGLIALVNSSYARNLQYLHLSDCNIGEAGVAALTESPHMARLREVWLSSNNIGLKGVRALIASPYLQGLSYLHLGPTGATAKKELKARFGESVSC